MQPIIAIAKREIKRLVSKPLYLFSMLFAPLFSALFFLSLMDSGLPVDLPVAVVDGDNSSTSRNLTRRLSAFQQTEVVLQTVSFTEARIAMQEGKIYGIYYIPKNFSVNAASGKRPEISFYTNYAYLIAGSLLFRDMKTMSVLAGGAAGLQTGMAKGFTEDQIKAQLQPIVIDTHHLGNPWLNYSVYLNNTILPGILQLMIFLVTIFSIGSELKMHTSHEWLRMGHYSLTTGLTGKLLPHTIIFTLVGFAICTLLYSYCGFPVQTGWCPMLSAMFLLVIASQAVGVMMIGVLPTLRLGLSFGSLFGMLSFSIVGFSFPVTAMHPALHALSNLFPMRHYFLIYVDQALNGRSMYYSWTHYLALLFFLLLPLLVHKHLKRALLSFKYIP
ncbi:MAG: ABC transporter permease [Tannerella sp.]|jgi:ABC-2 type transport system permease protein|nr:ABC transporter permease [Tannerella sp.]